MRRLHALGQRFSRQVRKMGASLGRWLMRLDRAWDALFGAFCIWVALAILANIPLLQLASLGYLMEVSRRVGQSGRLRDALVGVRKASRLGSLALAVGLLWMIPTLLASLQTDAQLIDAQSHSASVAHLAVIVACAWVCLHSVAATSRGGRLRHFLWPRPLAFLRATARPGAIATAWAQMRRFWRSLRFPYYFALGARGLAFGVMCLVGPTTLLIAGARWPLALALGLLSLTATALALPILQARLAMMQPIGDLLRWQKFWGDLRRAPIACLVAVAATLALSTPLYLAKIELLPREASWLPSLLFVAGAWPAHALSGWAIACSQRHEPTTWRLCLAVGVLITATPLGLAYASLSYLTQFVSWYGPWSLYEQHAFLLPVPFIRWPQ